MGCHLRLGNTPDARPLHPHKRTADSADDQGDYPFQFVPPLPWRYTTSGTHRTAGQGYADALRFSIGTAEDTAGSQLGVRVRLLHYGVPLASLLVIPTARWDVGVLDTQHLVPRATRGLWQSS